MNKYYDYKLTNNRRVYRLRHIGMKPDYYYDHHPDMLRCNSRCWKRYRKKQRKE